MKQFDWYLTRARSELIPWVLSRIPRQPIGIYAISGVIGAGASVFVVHDAGRWSAVMSVLMAVTSITFCAMGLLAYRKSKQVIGDLSVPNDRCAAQAARSHRLLISAGTLAFASVMVMAASGLAMGFRTLWVSYVLITPMIAAAVYGLVQAASRARASEMAPSLLVAVNTNDAPKGVELLEFANRPKARANWAIAAIASTGRESFAQARRMANLTGDPTAPRAVEFPGATVDLLQVAVVRTKAGAYGFAIWLPFAILPLILAGLVPTGAYPRVPGPGDVIAALRIQPDRGVDDKNAQSIEPEDEPEQTDPQHDGTAGADDNAEQSGGSEGSGTEPETEGGPGDEPSDGDDAGQAPGGADGTADEGDAGTGESAGAEGAPADGASEAGPEGSQSGSDGAAADGDSSGESSTEGAEAGGDDAAAGEASNRAPSEADAEGQSAEGDAGADTGAEVEGAQETGEAQGEATGDVPDDAGGDVADGSTTGLEGKQSEPGGTEPSEQEGTQGEATAEGAGDVGGEVAEAGEAPGEGTPNAEGREPGGEADAEAEPSAGPGGGGDASGAGQAEPGASEASEAEAENADPQGGEGGQSGQGETGSGGNDAEAGSDDADGPPEGEPSTEGDPDGAEPGEGEAAEGVGGGASEAQQADAETSDAVDPQSPAEGAPPPTDVPNSDGGIGGQEPPTPNGEENDVSVTSGGEADVAEADAQEVSVGGAPDGAGAGTPDAGAEAEPLEPQPPSTRPDAVPPDATATRAEEDAVDPAVLEDLNLQLVDVAADLDADLETQSLGAAQGPRQQFAAPGDIADMIVLPPASVVQDVPTTPALPQGQPLPAWIYLLLRPE